MKKRSQLLLLLPETSIISIFENEPRNLGCESENTREVAPFDSVALYSQICSLQPEGPLTAGWQNSPGSEITLG
jgi:hypothetical protein